MVAVIIDAREQCSYGHAATHSLSLPRPPSPRRVSASPPGAKPGPPSKPQLSLLTLSKIAGIRDADQASNTWRAPRAPAPLARPTPARAGPDHHSARHSTLDPLAPHPCLPGPCTSPTKHVRTPPVPPAAWPRHTLPA